MLLKGKVAIVTGAAAGIGAGIARLFREEGACVFGLDKTSGPDIVAANVRSTAQIQAAVDDIRSCHGEIDILINNAGIYPRQEFVSMTEDQWDEVQDVNLKGVFRCTKAVVPAMIGRRAGKIVNVSSVTFLYGPKGMSHYVASKGGVIGFTRSLARELGEHNIHVNCVTPGAVLTENEAQFVTPERVREMVTAQCLGRRILPVDVARVCLFLASHLSDGMTGQTLNVDGGRITY
jgi:3-oxoacyl-[acyl-carrier protein] reductase